MMMMSRCHSDMEEHITHGNFFSGSGTWELMMQMLGVPTLWESEIEPFPVALEAKRFPNAKQLGDITKVNGAEIEPVDIMTNSSPCQDISVAGKRAGMGKGTETRSSLFHEVIRITKEMREHDKATGRADKLLRPVIWCWENVPGLLSSNAGEDFRKALEEIARIKEPSFSVPKCADKWSNAGLLEGNGWSIAWCIRDAASQGVPQKRRRVFLVADFSGQCAAEILFESKGLHWKFAQIAKAWEGNAGSLEERINTASGIICGRS